MTIRLNLTSSNKGIYYYYYYYYPCYHLYAEYLQLYTWNKPRF